MLTTVIVSLIENLTWKLVLSVTNIFGLLLISALKFNLKVYTEDFKKYNV